MSAIDPKSINLSKLNFCLLSERTKLPRAKGVYLVISQTNEVLYVGKSNNIMKRWVNHGLLSYLIFGRTDAVRVAWIKDIKPGFITATEKAFIRHFKPVCNVKFKGYGSESEYEGNLRQREKAMINLLTSGIPE